MPRLAKTPGQPLTEVLKTRLTPIEVAGIDKARGHLSRSEWNRDLIRGTLSPKTATEEPQLHSSEVRPHRHKRGEQLRVSGTKGRIDRVYACAEPGCDKELS